MICAAHARLRGDFYGIMNFDAILLVPMFLCVHGDVRGLSAPRFLGKMTARYTQGGLQLVSFCQTIMRIHRSVNTLQAKLADNAFWERPTCLKTLNEIQFSL